MLVINLRSRGTEESPLSMADVLCDVSGAFLASWEFISLQAHHLGDRPGPAVWIGRNSLTRSLPLRLPRVNSHRKSSFCLWHSATPRLCLGGSVTDSRSVHPSGVWPFQSELKGAIVSSSWHCQDWHLDEESTSGLSQ